MASHENGLLQNHPSKQKMMGSMTTGLRRTGMEAERDGFLYVPESYDSTKASPLLVMFHAAGADAHQSIDLVRAYADKTRTIVLAPESQSSTWDQLEGEFGEDVMLLDEALSDVFSLYRVDTAHLAVGGIEDGASYAIAVGMKNPQLFSHVISFSEGSAQPNAAGNKPKMFASQGNPAEITKQAFAWFLGAGH